MFCNTLYCVLQEWTLQSENGGNILLTFVSFDLPECDYDFDDYTNQFEDKCTCDDYVEVSYGTYSERFCGDTVPDYITSCGSSMVIKFHSDRYSTGYWNTGTGFRAEWEELTTSTPCSTNRDYPNGSTADNLDQVEASFTVYHASNYIIAGVDTCTR